MPRPAPFAGVARTTALKGLGARIRRTRKSLGVSAVTTAEAANLSRVTLHRIERGEPSVTIGAYVSVMQALGLELTVGVVAQPTAHAVPNAIRVADYPQLSKVAWSLGEAIEVTPIEALSLYERNWRHIDATKMTPDERALLDALINTVGRGHLLV